MSRGYLLANVRCFLLLFLFLTRWGLPGRCCARIGQSRGEIPFSFYCPRKISRIYTYTYTCIRAYGMGVRTAELARAREYFRVPTREDRARATLYDAAPRNLQNRFRNWDGRVRDRDSHRNSRKHSSLCRSQIEQDSQVSRRTCKANSPTIPKFLAIS